MSLSVFEFFAVGKIYTALIFYAVKGGEKSPINLIIREIYSLFKVHLSLFLRLIFFISHFTLSVIAIGAITNIASAILLDNTIINRIAVIWLGGNAYHWKDTAEFNMKQDIAAARVVFNSKVPLVQLPCMGVVSEFRTTGPELRYWLKSKNRLCDYLLKRTCDEALANQKEKTWSRVIWDVTAVSYLLRDGFVLDKVVNCPIIEYDYTYSFDDSRHKIRCAYHINRDRLLEDLFDKLIE